MSAKDSTNQKPTSKRKTETTPPPLENRGYTVLADGTVSFFNNGGEKLRSIEEAAESFEDLGRSHVHTRRQGDT
jgi:hypothetical protein